MRTIRTVMMIVFGLAIAALLMFETSHYLVLGQLDIDDWVPGHLAGEAFAALGDFSARSLVVWAVILASYVLVGLLLAGFLMELIEETIAIFSAPMSEADQAIRHRYPRF